MMRCVVSSSGRAGFSVISLLTLLVAWVVALVCGGAPSAAQASSPMPRMPPEAEPAAWQRAGLEAALADPDFEVQYHALDYCASKKWAVQFHFTTEQWLKWLGHAQPELRAVAAKAAGQLGAQMPAEVQRALLHLLADKEMEPPSLQAISLSLSTPAQSLTPDVQMALVAFLQRNDADGEQLQAACQALGSTGTAMTPATQQALLALVRDTRTTPRACSYAADALAHLGMHMPPQVRQAMLGVLLDARADYVVRCFAAEAMGRLGPQMPPQARQFLLATLRDPRAHSSLRFEAAPALAQLGPHMPPEVQQALLAAYTEPLPAHADGDARFNRFMQHDHMTQALALTGPDMPTALQQSLLATFLQSARIARQASVMVDGWALQALAGTRPPAPAVLAALLREFQDPAATAEVRESISSSYLQPLAEHGALPPEVQRTLLATAQDGRARPEVRGLAALALGHLRAHPSPAVQQALLTLLQDQAPDSALRFSAVEAMQALGSHMPPEAAPTLVNMIQAALADAAAAPPPTGPAPFASGAAPPAGSGSGAPAKPVHVPFPYELGLVEFAVPALGNLGDKMSPEAQEALLGVIQHPVGSAQTPWDAAYALAQMGDKLPPQTQQRLLALLHAPGLQWDTRLAIRRTLAVSGIHPVTDAQVASLLAETYAGGPDPDLRFFLYLWLGRSPEHLQAVR
jgi:hypothetical protein